MSVHPLMAAMEHYCSSTGYPVASSQDELVTTLRRAVSMAIFRTWHVELSDAQEDDLHAAIHAWFHESYLGYDHEAVAPRP